MTDPDYFKPSLNIKNELIIKIINNIKDKKIIIIVNNIKKSHPNQRLNWPQRLNLTILI
jgi:hypothetical protein